MFPLQIILSVSLEGISFAIVADNPRSHLDAISFKKHHHQRLEPLSRRSAYSRSSSHGDLSNRWSSIPLPQVNKAAEIIPTSTRAHNRSSSIDATFLRDTSVISSTPDLSNRWSSMSLPQVDKAAEIIHKSTRAHNRSSSMDAAFLRDTSVISSTPVRIPIRQVSPPNKKNALQIPTRQTSLNLTPDKGVAFFFPKDTMVATLPTTNALSCTVTTGGGRNDPLDIPNLDESSKDRNPQPVLMRKRAKAA
jgi:hypothetical protein